MLPAQQGFHARHFAQSQIDFGLVVEHQLPVLQGFGYPIAAFKAGAHMAVNVGVERMPAVAALLLG